MIDCDTKQVSERKIDNNKKKASEKKSFDVQKENFISFLLANVEEIEGEIFIY
jgi:hypothetical protein